MDDAELSQRHAALAALLHDMGAVLVAFSGGVDSALVLSVAAEVLGPACVALTAVSPTFPPEELDEAARFGAALGVRHLLVDSHELEREGYAANAGDRCYFCKSELFDLCFDRAAALGVPWVLDGTVLDDLGEHRPGLVAAGERAVRHPLVEAGFTKAHVRALARLRGVPVWDKPAFSCLGSRFPVGTRVTVERVRRVQKVESWLRLMGFRLFRARYHELEGQPMCRLELDPSEIGRVLAPGVREGLDQVARAEGFRWMTLDLAGYQRGSLSHALSNAGTAPTPPPAGGPSSSS
jgi:uncharacterized protein